MDKKLLKIEIIRTLCMIYDNYGVLDGYHIDLIEDTLNDCLKYLGDKK